MSSEIQVTSQVTPEAAPASPGETGTQTANAWFGRDTTSDSATDETTEAVKEEPTPTTTSDSTESEESSAENQAEQDTDEQDEQEEEQEPKKKSSGKGFEKRIERFNRKIAERDAEIEYWKKAALGQQAQPVQPAAAQSAAEPKFSDYNDIDSYTRAHSQWAVQQAVEQLEQRNQVKDLTNNFAAREAEFKKVAPDYADVMAEFAEDYAHVTAPEVNQYLAESEVGPAVYHYLATHREETDRILALPPYRRLGELGKIEARLSKPANVAPEKKVVSKAPPPVKPEKGSAGKAPDLKDPGLSQEQYRELRMKQRARRF